MLYTIREFCSYVERDLNGLIAEVADITRNVSDEEKKAYRGSYPIVASMLSKAMAKKPSLGGVHISTMQMLLEYKLPAAAAWCDLVLLGNNSEKRPEVIIVELKNYLENVSDAPGSYEGLMIHKNQVIKHPSDQVKGYTEYCRRFHSTVHATNAEVNGCVFFTQPINLKPYRLAPNATLTTDYPIYNTMTAEDLSDFICEKIDSENEEFAAQFVNGYYQQDRNILRQVALNLKAETEVAKPFVLLDEQRYGFNRVMDALQTSIKDNSERKDVIIVEGPPGSGKSAVAVNLWIEAVLKYSENKDCGNVVYVTTSSSQGENWKNIFNHFGGSYNASDLVVKANDFNPGMNGSTCARKLYPVFSKKDQKYIRDEKASSLKFEFFEDYLKYMLAHKMTRNYRNNLHFLSIVDEAHALINPAKEGFRTNKTAGWCFQMGPQVYHIIRESQISVFFTDSKQSFRDNETTSVDDIKYYAEKLGAKITTVSLEGMQFRCAGSVDYVQWVEQLFTPDPLKNHSKWKKDFKLRIVDYPSEMENDLKAYIENGDKSCRILSSYTRAWVSRDELKLIHDKMAEYDFVLHDKDGKMWRNYWNNPMGYEVFVQGSSNSSMAEDPLCEVGCPYVVRGFDYNHVGLLWLKDLIYRNGHWFLSLNNIKETAIESTKSDAKEEQKQAIRAKIISGKMKDIDLIPTDDERFPKAQILFASVGQAYRILMTRAIKTLTIYIEDKQTRDFVRSLLID